MSLRQHGLKPLSSSNGAWRCPTLSLSPSYGDPVVLVLLLLLLLLFLCLCTHETNLQEKRKVQRIVEEARGGRALLGYATPSDAKELFRVRIGPSMPWPEERGDFQSASESAARSLGAVLRGCLEAVLRRRKVGKKKKRKKKRVGPAEEEEEEGAPGACLVMPMLGEEADPVSGVAHCPLDYFHYYNRDSSTETGSCSTHSGGDAKSDDDKLPKLLPRHDDRNCGPHVDRGF